MKLRDRLPFQRRWAVTFIDPHATTITARVTARDEWDALAEAFTIAAEHDLDVYNVTPPVLAR